MIDHTNPPKLLFISADGRVYPDTLICSGELPTELGGKPCPFSQAGRIPEPIPLDPVPASILLIRQRKARPSLPTVR